VTVTGQLRNYWEVELNLHYTLIDWLVFNANFISIQVCAPWRYTIQ